MEKSMCRRSSIYFFSFLLLWALALSPLMVCACNRAPESQAAAHRCCPDHGAKVSEQGAKVRTACCGCFSEIQAPVSLQETSRNPSLLGQPLGTNFVRLLPEPAVFPRTETFHFSLSQGFLEVYLKNHSLLL